MAGPALVRIAILLLIATATSALAGDRSNPVCNSDVHRAGNLDLRQIGPLYAGTWTEAAIGTSVAMGVQESTFEIVYDRNRTAAPASGSFTFTANLGGGEIGDETVWERPAEPLQLPLLSGEVIWEISDTSFNMVQTGTANPFTTELPFGDYIVTVHSTAQDDFSQTEASLALYSARNLHAIFPPISSHQPTAQGFGPAQPLVESAFKVSWEGEGLAPRGHMAIVPSGTPEGEASGYRRIQIKDQATFTASAEPGTYETCNHFNHSERVMSRRTLEVAAAYAQIDVGAGFVVRGAARSDEINSISSTTETVDANQRVVRARAIRPTLPRLQSIAWGTKTKRHSSSRTTLDNTKGSFSTFKARTFSDAR
ncbi:MULTISPECIES: hypothetical protein [Devosia]|uniref:hypothetical protein n=1 Tax=Devosia TaxID=46913 RepID=UPI000CE98746|nr:MULTISPECIES: hypothetical protein [Devosia]AVF02398.1 hypothetical protein C4375_00750 [Devosia sp. I507]